MLQFTQWNTACRKIAVVALAIVPIAAVAILPTRASADSNLVANGNFALGNVDFTSGYGYYPNGSSNSGSGHDYYQIGPSAQDDNALWVPLSAPAGSGSSNYMYVDASTTANTSVWNQSVAVQAGHTYTVSGMFTSLYSDSPPQVAFTIDNTAANSYTTLNTPGTWQNVSFTYTATSNVLNLGIVDKNLEADGNDFALDNLSVQPVPEASTMAMFGLLLVGGTLVLRKRKAVGSMSA